MSLCTGQVYRKVNVLDVDQTKAVGLADAEWPSKFMLVISLDCLLCVYMLAILWDKFLLFEQTL